jgi:hypothetical protein
MVDMVIDNGVVSFDENKYPKIASLVSKNILFIENNELVGRAADGVVVGMCCGLTGVKKYDKRLLDNLEHYLTSHPAPDTW